MQQHEQTRRRLALVALLAGALAFGLTVPGARNSPAASPDTQLHLDGGWSASLPAAVSPAHAARPLLMAASRIERRIPTGAGVALIGELLGLIAAALAVGALGGVTAPGGLVTARAGAVAPRAPPVRMRRRSS